MSENPISESSDLAEVNEQCAELERQMSFLRIGLVIASITLTVFLAIQWKRASTDLMQIRTQAEILKQEEAALQAIIGKFAEYTRTHPNFAPIAGRYGIKPAAAPAPTPLLSAPPAAPPKK